MKKFGSFRHLLTGTSLVLCVALASAQNEEQPVERGLVLGAAGWMHHSIVGHSSDNDAGAHYNGKSVLSTGAEVTLEQMVSERLDVVAGVGIATGNTLPRSSTSEGGYALHTTTPYVSRANFTYKFWNSFESKLILKGGMFSYMYNPDAKNLGLYLFRGPVYPGYLISGFETRHVLPTASITGLHLQHQLGAFSQDFILTSEMDFFPFFDLSPGYVATYRPHRSLSVGAGVNFYHLIPVDRKLTYGKEWDYVDYSDTAGGAPPDTTYLSFAGTKVAGFFSFDPKQALNLSGYLGPEDLKLYGEVALLGLGNDRAHRDVYGEYTNRMPVMLGFNLPLFKALDHLSLEVEWYGARFEDNLDSYRSVADPTTPSPYPYNWDPEVNVKRDNWKWSLHGARMLKQHIRISFQLANDHWRPGIYVGDGDNDPPRRPAIMVTPEDWYFSSKLAYFF